MNRWPLRSKQGPPAAPIESDGGMVARGGTTGQIYAKASDSDFDAGWIDPLSGGAEVIDGSSYATAAQGLLADSALQPGAQIPWTDITGAPALFDGAYSSLSGLPALFDGAYSSLSGLPALDPLDLTETDPAAPSGDVVRVFRREIAGRQLPAFIGPSGLDSALQPLLARNKVGYWNPPGNATTVPGVFGFTAPTVTGFTATTRNVAATNMFTRMRRLGYRTATTAGAVGQWRVNANQYSVGDASTGLGGFTHIIRFGISDPALVSGARMFRGMRVNATPTNVEPSTLTNCVGMGHGAADTNFFVYYGGSAAQTPIDLGSNFPCNTRNVDAYELALFSAPNSGDVHWQVTRVNTGDTASGTITNSGTTVLPSNTSLMTIWGYRTNNATAAEVGMDVMSAYIETDQ